MIGKDVIEALNVALPALVLQQSEYEHSLNMVEDLVIDQEERDRRAVFWKSAIEDTEKAYQCLLHFSVELEKIELNKSKEIGGSK